MAEDLKVGIIGAGAILKSGTFPSSRNSRESKSPPSATAMCSRRGPWPIAFRFRCL